MRLVLGFATLFVLGLAGTGYVIATAPEQAAGDQTLELTPTDPSDNVTVRDYENLSESDRRLVSEAIESNGTTRIEPDQRPNAGYVRYEGSVYRLRVVVGDPEDGTAIAHLVAVGAGGLSAVVGALGLVGLLFRAWQRDRRRA
ncbi:hypothetical protein BV210_03095 [Halorientalis sp. IM1011]|uniref:hypothetical protein n=1 Tax=Halorientalis sp. IM1011 TaxID=1932360 RepID=UPI00097CC41A|nr:hypothetical protein [Halorientalis sp. IM1011]AQL41764.1 hypothetical protein BV210_03095 [Halorientalis sp. IM1011]